MKGYMGRILRVDLSQRRVTVEPLDEGLVRSYLGGTGLASRILYTELDPRVDPLGPANKLIFAVGPLNGTTTPMSGRHVAVAKSPLTGLWGEGDAGGFWGYEFKRTGFDVLIVEGAASSPVYLWIADGQAEIRPADALWGQDALATEGALKAQLGAQVRVSSIGQGGENLVRFAAIMNDGGRTIGRGGLGAVMGSKKLKAIAVSGNRTVELADPELLKQVRAAMLEEIRSKPTAQRLGTYGTGADLDGMLEQGNLPLKNWAGDTWSAASAQAISINQVPKDSFKRTKAGCYGCPIGCEKVVTVSSGPFATPEGHGPEYETLAALGSLLLNDNFASIAKANDLCNRYGIDTIEAGTTIALAMECFERGLLTEREAGMPLNWGNAESIVRAIDLIGRREGIGDLLAAGTRGAAAQIGGGAPEYAMHVKGSSLCMHDPRIRPEMGLKYATLPMGAYHGKGCALENPVDPEVARVASTVFGRQNMAEATDCLVMCSFAFEAWAGGASRDFVPKLLLAVTGQEWDLNGLSLVGERIFNLKRAFVTALGVTRADDRLPGRFTEIPRVRFGSERRATIAADALQEYYRVRGWSADGKPTAERLKSLGIEPLP